MEFSWNPLSLRQYRSYPGGRCVDFNDEGLVKVWMDQERCTGESFLEALKSLGSCWCPGQRLGSILEEISQWNDDGSEVLDERLKFANPIGIVGVL